MRAPTIAFVLLTAISAARADPSVATRAPDTRPVPDGGLYLAAAAGGALGGDGRYLMSGSLTIDRHLFWRIGAWIDGAWGYLPGAVENEFMLRLAVGGRIDLWRSESKKVRLIANLCFVHLHQAPVKTWLDHPLESLLGSSDHGLHHRFGAEAGAGLLLTPWIDKPNWFARRLRLYARASVAWLPDRYGQNGYLSLFAGAGVAL